MKVAEKPYRSNPYQKPQRDVCYHCRLPGHRFNNCPTRRENSGDRRQIHVVDELEKDDCDEENGLKSVISLKDGVVTYVVEKVLCAPKQKDQTWRRKIFQVKCRVGEVVCMLIINSCSCENFIKRQLMEKLQLPTRPQLTPYRVGQIKEIKTIQVTWICQIPISLGKTYSQTITCDVVNMDTCGVLLWRPRYFDFQTLNNGEENSYTFVWNKKRTIVLHFRNVKNHKVERIPIVGVSANVKELSGNI